MKLLLIPIKWESENEAAAAADDAAADAADDATE